MSKVAIFGIGPAGLAAGWAAIRAGFQVQYFNNTGQQSSLYGCQYLHSPIPLPPRMAANIKRVKVAYTLRGTPEQYRRKVYGDSYQGSVSPEDLESVHDAWDIRATYDALWTLITKHRNTMIAPAIIDHKWIQEHPGMLSQFAHVISTIPAPALCANPSLLPGNHEAHHFSSHKIKAAGSRTLAASLWPDAARPGEIVCDGTDKVSWYRSASVFGYKTIEWPDMTTVGIPSTYRPAIVRKPLANDCDCHPEIIRLGRYGAWRKGILVHNVYEDAVQLLNGSWVNQS